MEPYEEVFAGIDATLDGAVHHVLAGGASFAQLIFVLETWRDKIDARITELKAANAPTEAHNYTRG